MTIRVVFLLPLFLPIFLGIVVPKVQAFKAPFHARDVLPFLPQQVSQPILNVLHNPADLLPTFVGAAKASSVYWKGACFYETNAWLELHNKGGSKLGGGTLHIKVSKAHSWTCMDIYIAATPFRVKWDFYFRSGEHTIQFDEWESEAELEYVKSNGVSVFLMKAGMLGSLRALWEVYPLFSNSGWGEKSNIAFLKKHMGATFVERPQPWAKNNIKTDEIHSGDMLILNKIRGRAGAFETLEKWVTGAFAGHAAVCLRDDEGKLWVAESGRRDEKGNELIAMLPWEEYWDFELKRDEASPHISLLPLRRDLRARFNREAAWKYAKSMTGKPYGFHNVIFSWIDTGKENFPAPLNANLVASLMIVFSQLKPRSAGKMWNEALNKRLGTQNLTLSQVLVEVEKRGSSFGELLAIPEKDEWIYSDGKSTSCIAFVLQMYKDAGIFGKTGSSIQATEFTVKDTYSLKIFEDNPKNLPSWCYGSEKVKLPYCQILGRYRMDLPGFNTVNPYPHMNEKCQSLPPRYHRSRGC